MALIVAGVSHATAPIEVREKLVLRPHEALTELARMRENGFTREGVVLSTCNRTEIYAVDNGHDLLPDITSLLSYKMDADRLYFFYFHINSVSATNIFLVAFGLDFIIFG